MKFIIILFLFSNIFLHLSAQVNTERLKYAMDVDDHHPHYSLKQIHNEVSFAFTGLFIFYKSFVSSQDIGSCTFTPSCSEYGLMAIERKGILIGMLATFDRLSRCNGLSPKDYRYDYNKKLLIDPVD